MTASSKSVRIISILILTTILLFAGNGCSLYLLENLEATGSAPDPAGGAEKVLCSTEEVTLAWDPSPSEIAAYKIYYRSHESGTWILFDEIPADGDPEYNLFFEDFGNGEYDFGVVAVNAETEESAMHTSLDDTAQPASGWYLCWTL
jgi:hypothetical protein